MGNDDYHLGTSDEELYRLGFQHQVWAGETAALVRKAGFGQGQVLLDLGCGPGFATVDFARLVGTSGHVHALDASAKFTSCVARQCGQTGISNVTTHTGDVHNVPLPDSSVDGVFARWLMCFVSDPAKVMREIARVLKPGGTVAVIDYYNYAAVKMTPRHKSIERLFEAYHESGVRNGGSYDIGERLPALMHDNALLVKHIDPICRVARSGSLTWQWVSSWNASYSPKLVEQGLLSEAEHAEMVADWNSLSSDPLAFWFPPPMLAVIGQKPG